MVWLRLTLIGSARTAEELARALRLLAVSTGLEDACRGCRVWVEDDGETCVVHYDEQWASELDMRHRVRSDRFIALLALMEKSREAPDMRFDFVTTTRGLDYVAEVRGVDA